MRDEHKDENINNEETRHEESNETIEKETPDPVQPGTASSPPKTSGQAIASLVLGISTLVLSLLFLFLAPLTGIAGIILSILAFKTIKREGMAGRGMTIAGLIMSIIGLVISILFIALIVFAFTSGLMDQPMMTP
ncbi:uncharacterized protein DUF4190 [Salsuginibacillus halophilus]|uniref:Uncharacterized protein DUF4190 n=1 Tax=Salsuginibacillus halophilus TaxID=517424 RepID=A0A2P8HQL8_9BACI|nr:DUF4190 domain-containing protein [Salsuginibacillus halophilus]PSL48516.1 uncharacterized protein DUF4190 [Salsuginibacillus halophilus]